MGPIAARRAREVAERVHAVLALELLACCQAVELRALAPGPRLRAVLHRVREEVPFRPVDAPWGDALERMKALVASGEIARVAGV
jgi:histidine ammonia-lyase